MVVISTHVTTYVRIRPTKVSQDPDAARYMSRFSPQRTSRTQMLPDICQDSAHKSFPGPRCRQIYVKIQPIKDIQDPDTARYMSRFSPQKLPRIQMPPNICQDSAHKSFPGSRCRQIYVKIQPTKDTQDQGCRPVYGSFPMDAPLHLFSPYISFYFFYFFLLFFIFQFFNFLVAKIPK
jgi:hypothetical protein